MKNPNWLNELEAVFLDLGDTLLSLDTWWNSVCLSMGDSIRREFNLSSTEKELANRYQRIHTRIALRLVRGSIHYREVGIRMSALKEVLKSLGLSFNQETVERIFSTAMDKVARSDILFPETIPVLKILSTRYQLCLLSNGYGPWTRRFLKVQGIDAYFREIIVSSEVGWEKPVPEIFDLALHRMGKSPGKTLMVGDYYDTDIRGAGNAGMHTAWINPEHAPLSGVIQPDLILESLGELPAALGLEMK